eukprot:7050898-Pyramimonas_sp.AAC.1
MHAKSDFFLPWRWRRAAKPFDVARKEELCRSAARPPGAARDPKITNKNEQRTTRPPQIQNTANLKDR